MSKLVKMNKESNLKVNEIFSLAIQNHKKKNIEEAKKLYNQVLKIDPSHENANINIGAIFQELRQFKKAKNCYEKVIENSPNNTQAYTNLGVIFKKLQNNEKAIKCFEKAIKINSDYLDAHINLGIIFQELKEYEKSQKSYKKVIQIDPNNIIVQNNLGLILLEIGEFEKAKNYFEKIIEINPNYSRAYINLGAVFKNLQENEKALIFYKKGIEINPNYAQAQNDLGVLFQELGNYENAKNCYEKAVKINPHFSKAYCNLAIVLKELGENHKVINFFEKSIKIDPNNLIALNGITDWLTSFTLEDKKHLKNICLLLFRKNNISHNDIAYNAKISLIDQDNFFKIKEIVNSDSSLFFDPFISKLIQEELLHLLLQKSLIADKFLENLFCKIRYEALFKLNKKNNNILKKNLNFLISLAQQCWLNEYVYIQSDKETSEINILKDKLEKNKSINELELTILGCYVPLNNSEIIKNNLLIYKSKNNLFNDLILLQIKEPLKEIEIAKSIESLDKIIDPISSKVREQYEDHPYPRWRFAKQVKKQSFTEVINTLIKPNKIDYNENFENPDVLIAGCGTGKDPISANIFKNANILAVDLSLTSLAYAKRKTLELNYNNINYLHADILHLKKLNKKFDIIQSSGVLHHMKNPIEGLKILLDMLYSHGCLRLGLYSEIARQNIVKARALIKKNNYKNITEDIKKFRQIIINEEKDTSLKKLSDSLDFYATSTTRDLLFHTQEHRFTIPEISKILNDLNLEFIGFEIPKLSTKIQYSKLFPNDKKNVSLDNWHQYEMDNPETFVDMYQFWVKKC